MRSRTISDEELTSIRPRPAIGHTDYTASIMTKSMSDLIFDVGSIDGLTSFSFARWIPTLNYEAGDISVENRRIIVGWCA